MARIAFCADEHVPQAVVSALRSNGYTVGTATEEPGSETVDTELLSWCADEGRVLITNDRDFVELSSDIDHAGIILYSTRAFHRASSSGASDASTDSSAPSRCDTRSCGWKSGYNHGAGRSSKARLEAIGESITKDTV